MNVKKFFIITNKEKDPDNALTGKIIEYIEKMIEFVKTSKNILYHYIIEQNVILKKL